jgi:CheY-like chemotaxis protein
VFERFRQGEVKATRRHQGLGLGLAIVRQLVDLHEGTVQAESPGLGKGATFTIRVPVMTSPTVVERRPPVERDETPPLPRLDGLHVLLVEDHPDSRELMSTVLQQAGASVTAVTSVKEAFEALKARSPHALVSDIGLPDEDGYALIRRLRRREAKYGGFLPAVALTGYVRAEDRARVLAAGYQAHVPKPVEAAELTAAVAALTRVPGTVSPHDE